MAPAYPNLWARMIANTAEPENEQACWPWIAQRDRWGYGRLNVYVPGLGDSVKLMAHLCAWLCLHAGCRSADELYLAYVELQASGLEIDHRCVNPPCCNPDHHLPMTPRENYMLRSLRRRVTP